MRSTIRERGTAIAGVVLWSGFSIEITVEENLGREGQSLREMSWQ